MEKDSFEPDLEVECLTVAVACLWMFHWHESWCFHLNLARAGETIHSFPQTPGDVFCSNHCLSNNVCVWSLFVKWRCLDEGSSRGGVVLVFRGAVFPLVNSTILLVLAAALQT